MMISSLTMAALFKPQSVALTVFVISLAAVAGLGLGSIKVRGLELGIGGVLFMGLLVGQGLAGDQIDRHVLEFSREFGLILFVYTIGAAAGPGFLASLRRAGLPLNLMAACIVLLGAGLTVAISRLAHIDMAGAVGIFSGASTNTPSLAAAQQALADSKGITSTSSTVAGYAIAYPFGVLGIIFAMVLLKVVFKVDLKSEAAALEGQQQSARPPLARVALEVANPNVSGLEIRHIPGYEDGDVVISRVLRAGKISLATPKTVLEIGDVLVAVGARAGLEGLRVVIGRESSIDVKHLPGELTTRRLLVTRHQALGKTLSELDLLGRLGVSITRIGRGEIELAASHDIALQFGDRLMAVGEESALTRAMAIVGNSPDRLQQPRSIAIFTGIGLGIVLGSIPFYVPGLPAAVKLGLAGGPLIVAMILSRLGHFGPLIWHLPASTNHALRELGIVLFLASVGINSGPQFFQTLLHGPGLKWMAFGAVVTLVPLLTIGVFARAILKLNYMSLCGLLAGSMTDPPALAFAGTITQSEAPGLSYAAVYPLVMVLRVLVAQALVLAFA